MERSLFPSGLHLPMALEGNFAKFNPDQSKRLGVDREYTDRTFCLIYHRSKRNVDNFSDEQNNREYSVESRRMYIHLSPSRANLSLARALP